MNTQDSQSDVYVNDLINEHNIKLLSKTVNNLRKHRFDAHFFTDRKSLTEKVLEYISNGTTVGIGGSQTVKQLNLISNITAKGGVLLNHGIQELSPEERLNIMRQQLTSDVFLCSANAISLQGEIYNVDGFGNRVAAMTFGPKKVIIVAGANKICLDENEAWSRISKIAAPINFNRLNRNTPCNATGICSDCNSEERGCNIYTVLRRKSPVLDISVFLINENLGF